ncbi:hypothetical protein [Anaerotruncus colihominis]|uniref:Uncharacterized protein n=1 Tax=Anaerotruncus colihominis TaxID=169435 RepID=A0A845SVS3_9FIRM|nr:hypothetical protein [Anaerotruncus colihominis]MCR2025988.1 hypothetical protein [Anaerotruncus colihominis]NDO38464.1 hypothetical protein [Anaerotruncus colihominis]
MRKRWIAVPLMCGALLSLAACGNYAIPDSTPPLSQAAAANPFEAAEEDAGFLGMLTHKAAAPNFSERGECLPFPYDGGEFRLEYQFSLTGKMDTVGFLLFLDGQPQPYKVNDTTAEYEYCHSFPAGEDQSFSFLFEPVSGSTGDTLALTVVSITNPDFQPDMESTSSYGWYHKTLDSRVELKFNADAPVARSDATPVREIFSQCEVREEKVTAQYVENELPKYGWGGVSMDTLDSGIYYTFSCDGGITYDNLRVSALVPLRFTMCGTAGTSYSIAFFLDHQPVKLDESTFCSITLNKGGVMELEAVIDPDKLGQFHTFYCVAVPQDGVSAPFFKTNSILLYKEN